MNAPMSLLTLLAAAGGGGHEAHWNTFEIVSLFINFFLFFGFLAFVVKKPMAGFLASRRDEFAARLKEAEAKQKEAEARLKEFDEKFAHLEAEIARVVKSFEDQGEADRKRLDADTDKAIKRLVREVDFTIQQESLKAQRDIRQSAVESTLKLAESLVSERITSADLDQLTEDYVKQIQSDGEAATPAS